jgi:hypothetical protein
MPMKKYVEDAVVACIDTAHQEFTSRDISFQVSMKLGRPVSHQQVGWYLRTLSQRGDYIMMIPRDERRKEYRQSKGKAYRKLGGRPHE